MILLLLCCSRLRTGLYVGVGNDGYLEFVADKSPDTVWKFSSDE